MRTRRRSQSNINKKIKSLSSLLKELVKLHRKGKKVVFTNGCFDILHYGHARYLQEAKDKGDILIVGVNSDSSIKKIKGKNRPIVDQKNRLGLLAALTCIDYLVLFKEDTPLRLIKRIKPDIIIKGADWEKDKIVGSDFVKSYGGKVLTIKLVKGLSTTNLIDRIVKSH
jgi:rfaE bifunctional protein nucleotidyltransferase chain/domain